jgi:hypothetical protein
METSTDLKSVIPFVADAWPNNRIAINFSKREMIFYCTLDSSQDPEARNHIHVCFSSFLFYTEVIGVPDAYLTNDNLIYDGIVEVKNSDKATMINSSKQKTKIRHFAVFVLPDSIFEIFAEDVSIFNVTENWMGYKL